MDCLAEDLTRGFNKDQQCLLKPSSDFCVETSRLEVLEQSSELGSGIVGAFSDVWLADVISPPMK